MNYSKVVGLIKSRFESRFVTFSSCTFPKEENTKSIRDPERLILKMYFLSCFWEPTNCIDTSLHLISKCYDSYMDLRSRFNIRKFFFSNTKRIKIYVSV